MVKMICVMFIVAASSEVLGSVTNLDQIVNVPLTTSVLNEFPNMDNSTPHSVVLGFLKGMITSQAKKSYR